MWELDQSVSTRKNETSQHAQYLGDDGEVGEVGEYFGEAGVINAGATSRSVGQSHSSHRTQLLTCYELKGRKRVDH